MPTSNTARSGSHAGASTPGDSTRYEQGDGKPAKTSAAAAFALVFGVSAIVLALTILLSPVALVLGIIGIILGLVGLKMAKRVGVTGKGVATGGLVLSVLAVLVAGALAIGAVTFLNNEGAVNRLENQVQKLKDNLPDQVDVPTP